MHSLFNLLQILSDHQSLKLGGGGVIVVFSAICLHNISHLATRFQLFEEAIFFEFTPKSSGKKTSRRALHWYSTQIFHLIALLLMQRHTTCAHKYISFCPKNIGPQPRKIPKCECSLSSYKNPSVLIHFRNTPAKSDSTMKKKSEANSSENALSQLFFEIKHTDWFQVRTTSAVRMEITLLTPSDSAFEG